MKYLKKIEEMPSAKVKRLQQAFMKRPLPVIARLDFVAGDEIEAEYSFPELTALCPMTGLPDTYTVILRYSPDKFLPELKSLRDYLLAFRDIPVLHEHLLCRIHRDFEKAVKPRRLEVTLDVAVRGGIKTRVTRKSAGAD